MDAQTQSLLMIVAMVAVFYFLLVRPQQRRAKQQREMLGALKPGDEIVTIGGIFATVVEVDERVRVRLVDGAELEIAQVAVSRVVAAEPDEAVSTTGEA